MERGENDASSSLSPRQSKPVTLHPLLVQMLRSAKGSPAPYLLAALLSTHDGKLLDFQLYECQEFQGAMMVAAAAASPAIKAALVLQLRLLEVDWPAELLSMQMAREVRDPESGQLLFRGLRAKVGIYSDRPLSIVPHTTTGRADYWGALVNRAARFMAGASGGQILSDARVMNEVLAAWEQEAVLQKDEQQSMSQAFTHRDTRRSGRLARLRTASARQLNSIKSGQTHARCSIDAILDTLGMHSNDTDDGRNAEVSSPAAVLLTSYPAAILRDITSACTCEQICLESQRAVQAVAHGLSGGDAPMRALSRYASSQLHNMPSRKSTLVCFGMMESQVNVLDLGDFELKGLSVPQALVGFELAHLADRSKGSSESSNGGSKAKCVRPGTGLLSKVPVWLPG